MYFRCVINATQVFQLAKYVRELAINGCKFHTLYMCTWAENLCTLYATGLSLCICNQWNNEILVYECNGTSCGPHSVIQIEMMYVKASFIEH